MDKELKDDITDDDALDKNEVILQEGDVEDDVDDSDNESDDCSDNDVGSSILLVVECWLLWLLLLGRSILVCATCNLSW